MNRVIYVCVFALCLIIGLFISITMGAGFRSFGASDTFITVWSVISGCIVGVICSRVAGYVYRNLK